MPVSLAFDAAHHYADALDGIEVPTTLCIGRQSVELLAKLGTGATHCMFERKDADSTFNRNFLGRSGWLDRLRIAIVDYDRLLFVSPSQS